MFRRTTWARSRFKPSPRSSTRNKRRHLTKHTVYCQISIVSNRSNHKIKSKGQMKITNFFFVKFIVTNISKFLIVDCNIPGMFFLGLHKDIQALNEAPSLQQVSKNETSSFVCPFMGHFPSLDPDPETY
jgi:hypothetical protein